MYALKMIFNILSGFLSDFSLSLILVFLAKHFSISPSSLTSLLPASCFSVSSHFLTSLHRLHPPVSLNTFALPHAPPTSPFSPFSVSFIYGYFLHI